MAGRPAELPVETARTATLSAKAGRPCVLSGFISKMRFPPGFQNPSCSLWEGIILKGIKMVLGRGPRIEVRRPWIQVWLCHQFPLWHWVSHPSGSWFPCCYNEGTRMKRLVFLCISFNLGCRVWSQHSALSGLRALLTNRLCI